MADKIVLTYQANTDQFNKDIKKATKNVNELDKATDDVNKSTKETFDSKGVKDYNKEVGNSSKGVGGLVGNLGKMVPIVGAAFSVGAVVGFVSELASAGREVLKIQKGLGRLKGVSDANLPELTAQVQALASTFGEGEDEILKAANTLSKTFGIDGAEALEQIERGFLSAANQNGDLLESLKEYSVQVKDAGLGVDQFVAILDQSGEQGIFSDKGIDVVKEFGLRIREQSKASKDALNDAFGEKFTKDLFDNLNNGSITTAQALEKVSKKLKDSTLPAKQLQTVVADVFGGPGEDVGIDFLKTLTDITAQNKDIVNEADAYTKEQQRQLETQQRFNEILNAIKIVALEIVNFVKDGVVAAVDLVEKLGGLDVIKEQLESLKQINVETQKRGELEKQNSSLAKESNKELKNSVAQLNEQLKEGLISQEQYNELSAEALTQSNEQLANQVKINTEFTDLEKKAKALGITTDDIRAAYGETAEGVEQLKIVVGSVAAAEQKRKEELKKQAAAQQKLAEQQRKAAEEREKQIQRETEKLKERAELILLGEEGTVERIENLRDREIKKLEENAAFRRLTEAESNAIIVDINKKAAEEIAKIGEELTKKEVEEQRQIQAAILESLKITAESEKATFEDKVKALQFERDFLLENDELIAEERINIESRFQNDLDSLRQQEIEKEIEKNEAIADAEQKLTDVRLSNAKSLVNGLQEFVEANTVAGKSLFLLDKALAIAEIIVNLQREVSSIAATNAVLGPAGVPLTAAQSTAAKIRAATGIATIVATTIQGFKDGVIDLNGPGTGTSDSITARLSKGESVMTAKETSRYKEELQAIRNNDFEDFVLDKYIAPYLNVKMSEIEKMKSGLDMPKVDNKLANGLLKQLVKGQSKPMELGIDTISKLSSSNRRSFY